MKILDVAPRSLAVSPAGRCRSQVEAALPGNGHMDMMGLTVLQWPK